MLEANFFLDNYSIKTKAGLERRLFKATNIVSEYAVFFREYNQIRINEAER